MFWCTDKFWFVLIRLFMGGGRRRCKLPSTQTESGQARTARTQHQKTSNATNLLLRMAAIPQKCATNWLHSLGKQSNDQFPSKSVNSKLLWNIEKTNKNSLFSGTNLPGRHCRIHVRCMFVAGPNERIFAAITFVVAMFVPRFSCACSSGPSYRLRRATPYIPTHIQTPQCGTAGVDPGPGTSFQRYRMQ